MENVIGVSVITPCFYCCCYDSDYGCTMPLDDLWYACPYAPDLNEGDFEK